ncbi:scavenger receptor cysteine-rich type 1 protein M130 [Tachysurus vachellii]|uniref:scavenger receptor cysteine-rich type 1 protein M130 n=1 Tax=Tachysurus vachellii TaxID=175792 RepID=UPI00296AAA82|nr:scavenger receptor cysteine-rich type 1 protein M130 [Tachysurus vachellii]
MFSTAQDRIALRGSSSPCEGRLEVYHDGQWGLVGHHGWKDANGIVVCKSLDCGVHKKSGILQNTYLKNQPENFLMDEILCTGNEKWLWQCPFSGWSNTHCLRKNFVSVVCSGNISLSLKLNGMTNDCAGVVQFTISNSIINVCDENWNDAVANKICQELNCGNYQKRVPSTFNPRKSRYSVTLNCTGNEDFLWQCAANSSCQTEISIICTNHNHIRLYGGPDICEGFLEKENITEGKWVNVNEGEFDSNMVDNMCAKMKCGTGINVKPGNKSISTYLKCSDRVKIQLENSMKTPSLCYGEIYVNVNGSHNAVCSKDTTTYMKIGEVVCRELQCGNALTVVNGYLGKQGQISLHGCNGQEKSLWECNHQYGKVGSCQTINIVCSASLDMRLSNGPDKCAGQLEVKYSGSWRTISSTGWTKQNSNMVCQHLECGESMDSNQYHFVKSNLLMLKWTLKCSGRSIFQCTVENNENIQQNSAVNILCNKHELWFLQGSSTCEGKVMGEKSGYLQNISNERADEVCKRNLCQGVQILKSDHSNSIITSTVYPENATSPNNGSMNLTTSTNPQDDYVKCSGSMEVRLQNKCLGKVLVCSNDDCGVCAETWTDQQSEMLCKILGCGQMIKETYKGKTMAGVTVASVHCSKTAENFNQCNFIQLKDTSLCQMPAYVACTGSVNAVLQDPRDKCAGIPMLFYSGANFPLCTNSMNKQTQDNMCANFGCGEALSFNESIRRLSTSLGLTQITCQDTNITKCNFSTTKIQTCEIGHLKCTDWRRLVVINHEDACKGEVYLQNEKHLNAVSNDDWKNQERNQLCKYLECGKSSEIDNGVEMNVYLVDTKKSFSSRSFSCPAKPNSIWDCENESASVKNSHQLHISCTDEPKMTLEGNCTGVVWLNNEPVCYKSEKTDYVLNDFCYQQGCSSLFKTWSTNHDSDARFLRCTSDESKLWQCNSGKSHCQTVVSVACAKALKWKFSRTCGGYLLVNYGRDWEYVCPLKNNKDADWICRDLKCGKISSFDDEEDNKVTDISINCNHAPSKLMHCFKSGKEVCKLKAKFFCDDYYKHLPQRQATGSIIWIVMGLMLLMVASIVMYWNRKTICTIFARCKSSAEDSDIEISENEMQNLNEKVARCNSSAEDSDIEISENEMQNLNEKGVFETDDYDDIAATVEDNQSDGSSELDEEDASSSQGSSGTEYDDVDEENVIKTAGSSTIDPILPPRPNNLPDNVTFETEVDPEEGYDDVMLPQTADSEQREKRESFDIPDLSSDPPLSVCNDEAKPQKDE